MTMSSKVTLSTLSLLLVFSGLRANAQEPAQITVNGTVVDAAGLPVIGAGVVEKSTFHGAVTLDDGTFVIRVPQGAVLEISSLGYITQEIRATPTVRVILQEDQQSLQEVIVTGFGLAQKRESMTGAISAIGSEKLEKSVAVNTSSALAGKIAGVNARMTDGRPGATTRIQIRNMGTPLYVIDGIIKDEGQFNNIDFNDIESISIMKDASASIYGVRAANGVIVVTTKKGAKGSKNVVELNAYYGWSSPSKFPVPADVKTYLEHYIGSETVQGTAYTYSKEDYAKWVQGTEKGYVPFDWYDFIWNTAPQYYFNANASGGSDKISYYISLGHTNQDSQIVNYGAFKRTNFQINLNTEVSDRLRIGVSSNGRIETLVNPGVPEVDDYYNPLRAVFRNLPTRRPYANDNPKYPTLTSNNASSNFAWLNYELSGKWQQDWRVIQLNGEVEYEILDGLKARGLVGYYYANQVLNNQEYTYSLYGYDEATDSYPVIYHNSNPWRERTMGYVQEITSNVQLSYDKTFGLHTVNAVIGLESSQRDTPSVWVHSIPTANSLHLIDYETMDTYNDTGDNTQARLGWLGRFNYDFHGRYLLELSGRYDGSWKFRPGHRWGFFPSASIGWRVSQENFWNNLPASDWFNSLKIRTSYGTVGDDEVNGYSAFDYMEGYNYKQGGAVIDGEYVIGSQARGLPNQTLSWLKANILDIGVDMGFLKDRLQVSLDYFNRKRTGLSASRYDVLIPSETGFSLPLENLNSDIHRGMDGSVIWNDSLEDFSYSVGGNFTLARQYDWEQYKPRWSNSWDEYRNSSWHRYARIYWGYEAIGQFQDWEEISTYPINNDGKDNTSLRPGDIKYKDQNGDGIINSYDQRPIGYSNSADYDPIFNYGINFTAAWKGFDLAMDFTGSFMSSFYPSGEMLVPFTSGGNNPQYRMEDSWHLSDIWDAESNYVPGTYPMYLIGSNSHSNYWGSSFWICNVRYLKLHNFELGYSIPAKLINKVKIQSCRIYFSAQNLFCVSNIKGVDPETVTGTGRVVPTPRILNLGINLKF